MASCGTSWYCGGDDIGCVETEGQLGTYATQAECEAACVFTYNCVDGQCQAVQGGGGAYATLADCQAACGVDPMGYECMDGSCQQMPGGAFSTIEACEAECGMGLLSVQSDQEQPKFEATETGKGEQIGPMPPRTFTESKVEQPEADQEQPHLELVKADPEQPVEQPVLDSVKDQSTPSGDQLAVPKKKKGCGCKGETKVGELSAVRREAMRRRLEQQKVSAVRQDAERRRLEKLKRDAILKQVH